MYSSVTKKFLKGALDVIAETIWPTRSAVCECSSENVLCEDCKRSLQYVDTCLACPKCGAPFGYIQCTECNDITLAKIMPPDREFAGENALPVKDSNNGSSQIAASEGEHFAGKFPEREKNDKQ